MTSKLIDGASRKFRQKYEELTLHLSTTYICLLPMSARTKPLTRLAYLIFIETVEPAWSRLAQLIFNYEDITFVTLQKLVLIEVILQLYVILLKLT